MITDVFLDAGGQEPSFGGGLLPVSEVVSTDQRFETGPKKQKEGESDRKLIWKEPDSRESSKTTSIDTHQLPENPSSP